MAKKEKIEKNENFIKFCMSCDPAKLNSGQASKILGISNKHETGQITARHRLLSLTYAPDKNPKDSERCTHIAQCLNNAREMLEASSKQPANANHARKHRAGGRSRSDFQQQGNAQKSSGEISEFDKHVIALAQEGILELKESVPGVFTEEFLKQFDLKFIPYIALIMKGIDRLLEEQNYKKLNECLKAMPELVKHRCMPVHYVFVKSKFDKKDQPLIGDREVTYFTPYFIRDIAALCLKRKKNEGSFKQGDGFYEYDELVSLSDIKTDGLSKGPFITTADHYINKVQESIDNKKILTELHESFKMRIKFFKNKKDKEKNDLFQNLSKEDILTKENIESVVNIHTGRYMFGLFKGQITSRKEYEKKKEEYAQKRRPNFKGI